MELYAEPMQLEEVRDAYSARAGDYVAAVGYIEATHPVDRELVLRWAQSFPGPVIDAGCGPGQWTNFLNNAGILVEGVDFVPAFIDQARRTYPDASFRVGSLDALEVPDSSVAGILCWYSIIHMGPVQVESALREFARCIKPGGSLLLGFFEGKVFESFPHAVTPAYSWPIEAMTQQLDAAGFSTSEVHERVDPGHRPHAAIMAHRRAD
jgi:ubiquinone/menaquinone biosynthesis C-methylase UbiE